MKKIIAVLFVVLLLATGCATKVKLKIADKIGAEVSKGAEKYLGCSGTEAIKSDVAKKAAKFLRVKEEKSVVGLSNKGLGSSLCVAAVNIVLPQLIDLGSGKLPEAWKCSGEPLKPLLDKVAQEACAKLKF